MARVLMIDDDDLLVELVQTRLEAAGHDVQAVYDGDAALAAIDSARPDLIILDQHLPGLSGMAVLERIRTDARLERLPVMMLTGDRDDALLAKAHQGGADDYLRKPIDLDELTDRAEAMLKGGEILRQAGRIMR